MKIIPFLAYKDLVRDKKIVILVIFLLAFSYINLTFFPAFLNGLSNTFQDEVVDTATSHIIIQPRIESKEQYLNFESSIRKKVDLVPGVVASSSHISLSGAVFFKDQQMGALVTALEPSVDNEVTTISQKILRGEFLEDDDVDSVILGQIIAGRKIEDKIGQQGGFGASVEGLGGVNVGEKVKIRFSNGVEKEYKVKGIVGTQGFSLVSQSVYISKKEAENILGIDDKASAILVRLNNKNDADRIKNLILESGIPNADMKTWEEASTFTQGIKQTFGIVTIVTTFVAVVVVVSTIGIVVFINSSRKKRIIGVLKAIGMQKNEIMMVFLFESLLFGVIGTVIGAGIVYVGLFYLSLNPILLPLGALVPVLYTETAIMSAAILIISSIIAGYLPARMASRQEVLETIRVVE